MLGTIFKKVFGTKNDREIKRLHKIVMGINQLESVLEVLSDEALKAKTQAFKEQLSAGSTIEKLLPEVFAVVREASRRVMGMRHFDVQMIGAMVLNEGKIPEMRTGEGKTLMSTLAAYLNALSDKGVHIVTVNEYLAHRDAQWMRPIYEFLGLTVGVIGSGQPAAEKRAAYACDITYGTNNEFGFDYLRDNMAFSALDRVQRGLNFAIVDEVDSILIDEARTPLVISGQAEDSSEMYRAINKIIPLLTKQEEIELDETGQDLSTGHYVVDEKQRSIEFTEAGHLFVENWLIEQNLIKAGESLYAPHNLTLLHHVQAALKAHAIFQKNVEYIVRNGEIMIVDEHTGRVMPGRRWGDGIHQAIEAKEGVTIQKESQTLASTTFQNYFRLYTKLSGMTGTADTEAFEFHQIYGLQVIVVPTNNVPKRIDSNDLVYLTETEKYEAIIEEIKEKQANNRPCLVGTASIEASERISSALEKAKIVHNVLNAKQHEREAEIIAQAGKAGSVTIATNMAGRGTDIVLGGNWEAEVAQLENPTAEQITAIKAEWLKQHEIVINAGGLHIIGTERHESRRIDNQLRGRAGRQGDPGSSRFFLSLEDNLMRIFASDRVRRIMQTLGMEKGEAIEHRMVSNAIEKAQRKVEGRNFDMRKSLLEFDDVSNDQRQVVYAQRTTILDSEDVSDVINNIREDVVTEIINTCIPLQSLPEQWNIKGLEEALQLECNIGLPIQSWLDEDKKLFEEPLRARILSEITAAYKEKEETVGAAAVRGFEKQILLQVLDQLWKEHLATMDQLRQGIHLRGYAQKNPKQEYKRESFALFEGFLDRIKHEVVKILCHVQVKKPEDVEEIERQRREAVEKTKIDYKHEDANNLDENTSEGADTSDVKEQPFVRDKKVGRNEVCPCGSGKKYKQCHGKIE